jgi:transposase
MIPTAVRIFLCTQPVDMRFGFDRLAQVARERVGRDPVEGGALSVFAGRGATRLKVLWYDRNGLRLTYRRLPPKGRGRAGGADVYHHGGQG